MRVPALALQRLASGWIDKALSFLLTNILPAPCGRCIICDKQVSSDTVQCDDCWRDGMM